MNAVERIIRGDPHRKTRFHDEKGNLVDAAGMLHAPLSLAEAALRVTCGYHPMLPWIPRNAIKHIAQLVRRDSCVLEFGSGMSTVWLASRCGALHSIESDPGWYGRARRMLDARGFRHVRLDLRDITEYANLSNYTDGAFDFVLIDGEVRDACASAALRVVRKGGYLYLDNSDKDSDGMGGDKRRAEELLKRAAVDRAGAVRYFVDFPPATFTASQGMLLRL